MKFATLLTPSSVYMSRTPFSNIPQCAHDPKEIKYNTKTTMCIVYVFIINLIMPGLGGSAGIFSTAILSFPLIQEGQLSVSGGRMCTILVNRLED